jgi:hypothetical protein
MKITIHVNDNTPMLELHSWLRGAGYKLIHRPDGTLHAVSVDASPVKIKAPTVVPFRRPIPNPFGGAA